MHLDAFEEIKKRLLRPTILHHLDTICIFQISPDTSKMAVGPDLYQIQNFTPKLIGYTSKRLPHATVKFLNHN